MKKLLLVLERPPSMEVHDITRVPVKLFKMQSAGRRGTAAVCYLGEVASSESVAGAAS
jgi:hypothetical protein